MRAITLFVALAATASTAFAAPTLAQQKAQNRPAPSTLCPIQGSAVNANCPLIKAQGQDARSCLPELSGSSEVTTSRPSSERESHSRK
jgi:hypothetical protein